MSNANDKIMSFIGDFADDVIRDEFMMYEPWDVEPRTQEILDIANKYHVDLHSANALKIYGRDPHEFQTGYLMDRTFTSAIFGGNQIGKSYCGLMDMLIMMTGEKPYALRYPKGHDTGIAREVSAENVRRFGRRDAATGELIDYNDNIAPDTTWNCGNITGVGVYPESKLAPRGQKAWLGTFAQAKDEYWWKRLKQFLPDYLVDRNRGSDGFAERKGIVYLANGNEIHVITYEQGYERFEAENVWVILLDEEPPDRRVYTSARTHISQDGVGVRLLETPYRGLTWTKEDIVEASVKDEDIKIYHATQFDSPYQSRKRIMMNIKAMKPWEIESRVFGMHSEQKGAPYFDRAHINKWLRSHASLYELIEFDSLVPWEHVETALNGGVRFSKVFEKTETNEWEVYEHPDHHTAYWMSVDTGLGATNAEDAQDRNCAHIYRAPREDRNENPAIPICVAACRSSIPTINFARNCLYAAMAYNFCLIAPESKGETAAAFVSEIRDYPFMFTMTVINNKTRKPTEKIGFDTNAKTRRLIFELIGDFLNEVHSDRHPSIPHFYTLKELAELIKGKNGRPDHPNGGTSDCAIAMGIGLYVWEHGKEQIRNNLGYYRHGNGTKDSVDKWAGRINNHDERRPLLGTKRGLDERSR